MHLCETEQWLTWYLTTLQDACLDTWRCSAKRNQFHRTIVDSSSYELKKPTANSSKSSLSQFKDIKTSPIWQDGCSQAIEKPRKELLLIADNASMGRVLPMTKHFNVLCCSQHNHTKFQYTSIMSSWYLGNNVTIKYPKLHLRTFPQKEMLSTTKIIIISRRIWTVPLYTIISALRAQFFSTKMLQQSTW